MDSTNVCADCAQLPRSECSVVVYSTAPMVRVMLHCACPIAWLAFYQLDTDPISLAQQIALEWNAYQRAVLAARCLS
jgi:hypothetical protein